MKQLVVVADDFGLCASVNGGIMEAQEHGIVTELSLMLGSPGTTHALQLVQEHHTANVGIHVLLKHWREHGDIFRRNEYTQLFATCPTDELQKLFDAELAEFERLTGHPPTHITSQYGIISNPTLLPIAVNYAAAHHIPMRLPAQALTQPELALDPQNAAVLRTHHVTTTDYFIGYILGALHDVQAGLLAQLQAIPDGKSVELMLHPGNVSTELRKLSSMVDERQRDRRLATDPAFRTAIEQLGFTICPYRSLQQ